MMEPILESNTTTQHYTMLSLGAITATLPNGNIIRHPLNFAFSGTAESLRNDEARQATINELIQKNATQCEEQLLQDGATTVESTLKLVAHVL